MKVRVTRNHLALADQIRKELGVLRGNYCPVALALQDCGINACVKRDRISLNVGRMPYCHLHYVRTPEPIREFIAAYDRRNRVRPFEFEFEIAVPE